MPEFKKYNFTKKELLNAAKLAEEEYQHCRADIHAEGAKAVEYLEKNHLKGIVLAGRPYHVDPEINHGIDTLITSLGLGVITGDSIANQTEPKAPLRVVNQWVYHARLYSAADFVGKHDNLELVQLNSFGCGVDAVTTDQVEEILSSFGKMYTLIKIDEVNNLGAARIRIRSLLSAIRVREQKHIERHVVSSAYNRVLFTKEMKKNYTILCPQMSPIHFDLLETALRSSGYNVEIMKESRTAVDVGLKYVNNDACYPSLIVVGQIMDALLSGRYDLNHVAIFMTQTGGGCRASNYVGFIRRALEKAGMAQIPVVSLNLSKLEANPGMTYTPALAIRAVQAIVYGDIFMRTVYRMRPYEKVPGSVNAMHEKWKRICNNDLKRAPSMTRFNHIIKDMIRDFDNIPIYEDKVIPRVGIVGEILVKFLPQANNHLVELLEREGAEAVMPDMLDFFLYCFYNSNFKAEKLGTSSAAARMCNIGITALEYMRKAARKAFAQSKHFTPPADIRDLAKYADPLVSIGNQTGEGWFLTGEIMELIHSGVNNVVCTQPFGCLPNHIVGKGVIKEIRHQYPESNIIAVDYDPGASEVNQLNRIKLMLATAQSNLDKDQKNKK